MRKCGFTVSGKVRRNYPSVLSKETNVEPKETSAESNPPPCSSVSGVSLSLATHANLLFEASTRKSRVRMPRIAMFKATTLVGTGAGCCPRDAAPGIAGPRTRRTWVRL